MIGRRKFLKAVGLAPAAPIAAKLAHEAEVMKLTGVGTFGYARSQGCPSTLDDPSVEQTRSALLNPFVRSEVVSELFKQNRGNLYLDPDIAVYRSFSLNAKLAFQRQRNVERELERMQSKSPWSRVNEIICKATDLFQ